MTNFVDKMLVYFVTDSRYGDHVEMVEKALKGGVRTVQFREKSMSGKEMYSVARDLRRITDEYDAIFIVNDRVDVAMAAGADGVHVGQSDLPAEVIRDFFDGIIGVTAHTVEEAVKSEKHADYLGVGPVFRTTTKRDARNPIGLEGLRKIVESVNVPVIAIGGINIENAADVLRAGARGIAVVSAIAAANDVEVAAASLVGMVRRLRLNE